MKISHKNGTLVRYKTPFIMAEYYLDILKIKGKLGKDIIVRIYEHSDKEALVSMVLSLYAEDCSIVNMDSDKIYTTIDALMNDPKKGVILVFEHQSRAIGYSILINFWSNEYGGNITFIDELFIIPEFRRKGIATLFFKQLFTKKINNTIAFQLEVTPKNSYALKLYKRVGFLPVQNSYYRYIV
jgi:GNAT superfamily N-acetyltransferase